MGKTSNGETLKVADHVGSSSERALDHKTDAGTNDIHVIQAECSTMISLLQDLEKEEHDLQCQLEILAKEALLCGFQNDVIEPPIPRKRKKSSAAAAAAQQQQQQQQPKEEVIKKEEDGKKEEDIKKER